MSTLYPPVLVRTDELPLPSRPYENVDIRKHAKNSWIEIRQTEWTLSVSRSQGGRPCVDMFPAEAYTPTREKFN